MAKNSISKISNAFSTGGGGVNFEQQIQAMFLLSLLIDGFCPAMNEQTKKVHFQAKHLGHDVDDLVVITYRNQSEGKMACQIKHSITATEKDKTFQEVICAAWNDFNKEDFDRDRDRIALVTAQISNKAQQSLRFLHVGAIGAIDAEAFMERIDVPVFSNNDNQKMLVAIKECISLAKGCEPTNEEVWKFCKAFILLLFDMDCAESVNRALSASLIKCNSPENPILVWSRLVEYAGQCNQAAASVSKENIDRNIRDLGYMYEPTLTDYLECLENSFEFGTDENTFEVWLKLRECMARIEPTEGKVIYKQLDRIQQLIEKMEPTDIRVKHRECYLGNRCLFDKGNYANRWKMLEDKKLSVVKEIFDEYGSEEVERFGCAVKNVHDVANKLGRFLRPNEMSSIIEKYFIGILSKEFTINCLISFVYTQGAEKLLETSLCQMEDEFMLEILSKIPFSLQLLDVINQVLDDDTAYWEKGAMPYSCYDAEELKIIVEKLVACKRYVTAVNIIGHSECEAVINAECIYKLMKLAGTEESIGVETLDDYAVQKIIGWFQQQEDIDLELRSDIEFIYLPMLDEYSEVRPRALNTRLSLEPEYFCSLIELFYKERNGEKREIELNKSLSDRLYEILFQFKVIPGIDWNGNFDAKRFDYWMKTVKTWSRDNDRYEVAMHTVGSGLSYAELDEDKLPQTAIIEELNRVENEELRRGYYLGIINQRGVHWIDPEGKPELELAEDYENKANIAESRGYSRYAGILRGVADEFKREAKSNILEAKNGDDE